MEDSVLIAKTALLVGSLQIDIIVGRKGEAKLGKGKTTMNCGKPYIPYCHLERFVLILI